MEVYAEFFQMPDGKCFRKKTLLKFGESIDLIGSAVLMNPGSAQPKGEANEDFLKSFYFENHKLEKVSINEWKKFNKDSTMTQLEKIFNGSYLSHLGLEKKNLNGVIQLFNCFYFRDQNSNEAKKNFVKDSEFIFNEEKYFLDKPVYFGWGNEGKFGYLKPIASRVFSSYDVFNTPIYENEFDQNCFYHPGYVNRSYKHNSKTQKFLVDFFNEVNK